MIKKPHLLFPNTKLHIGLNPEPFSRIVFKHSCIKTPDDLKKKKKNSDAQAGLQTN